MNFWFLKSLLIVLIVTSFSVNCQCKVKLLELMKTMDEEAYQAFFGDELMWTVTLSNGSVVNLRPGLDVDSSAARVHFADRCNYIDSVKQARMSESQQQVYQCSVDVSILISEHRRCA